MTDTMDRAVIGAPSSLNLAFGDKHVRCRRVDESSYSKFVCPDCGPKHGFIVASYRIDPISPPTRGLYVAMTPAHAREVAAALIEMANELDAGNGLQ